MQRKQAAAAAASRHRTKKKNRCLFTSSRLELVPQKNCLIPMLVAPRPSSLPPSLMMRDAHSSTPPPAPRRAQPRVENKRPCSVMPLSPDCQECNNSRPPVKPGISWGGGWRLGGWWWWWGGRTHLAELEMFRLESLLDGVVFPGSTRRGSRGGGGRGGGSRRQAVQHLSNVELLHFPPLRTRRLRESRSSELP